MNHDDLRALLERYHRHECSPEEEALLNAFFDSYTKKHQWRKWEVANPEVYEADLLSSIKEGIKRKEGISGKGKEATRVPLQKHAYQKVRISAYASIVLMTAFAVYFFLAKDPDPSLITKTTQKGQKTNIVLSDGTTIRLNAESTLVYPEVFDKTSRQVTLTGEAFFEVTENPAKPFIVRSGDLTTTVLGTSFNIHAYPGDTSISVTVATGKVKVESFLDTTPSPKASADVSAVVLTKAEQTIYSITSNNISTTKVDAGHFTAWKDGIIRFDDIPLKQAAQILERWFNVTITFENEAIGNCFMKGKYINENLVNILESIKYVKKIEYSFQNKNQILISGGSCEP